MSDSILFKRFPTGRFPLVPSWGILSNRLAVFVLAFSLLFPVLARSMEPPVDGSIFEHNPLMLPVRDSEPSKARPLGAGPIAAGGDVLALAVSLEAFAEPVDLFIGLGLPPGFAERIYIFTEAGTIRPISDGVTPWRRNVTGPVDARISDIFTDPFPPGVYYLYFMVTLPGDLAHHYLWVSSFTIPESRIIGGGTIGTEGSSIALSPSEGPAVAVLFQVPSGSLSSPVNVTVTELPFLPYELTEPGKGIMYDLRPPATSLKSPARVTVSLDSGAGVSTEELRVFALAEAEGTWIETYTESADGNGASITSLIDSFTLFRTALRKEWFETGLYRNPISGTLMGRAILARDLEDITPPEAGTPLFGYPDVGQWLSSAPLDLHLVYRMKLMKKVNGWNDVVVETKAVRYSLGTGETSRKFRVVVDNGDAVILAPGNSFTLDEIEEDWFSGRPLLIPFGVTPQAGAQYYLTTTLYFVPAGFSTTVLSDPRGLFPAVRVKGFPSATSSFPSAEPIDRDLDGIVNDYEIPLLYNGGVSPLSGDTNTPFTFYVNFANDQGTQPVSARVHVAGGSFPMSLMSGLPHNGIYHVNLALPAGEHEFYFSFLAENGRERVLHHSLPGPLVLPGGINSNPSILSADFGSTEGDTDTPFTFNADYFDWDGDAPAQRQLNIYGRGTAGTMSLESGAAADGRYVYTNTLGAGCIRYSFTFGDDAAGTVTFPSFGSWKGPSVGTWNTGFSPAFLSIPSCPENINPELSNGYVVPLAGDTCDTFTFFVDYYDPDGDAPAKIAVVIDGKPAGMSRSAGSASNGTYSYSGPLLEGIHSFYFTADDGHGGTARFTYIGELPGPEVQLGIDFSPAPACRN